MEKTTISSKEENVGIHVMDIIHLRPIYFISRDEICIDGNFIKTMPTKIRHQTIRSAQVTLGEPKIVMQDPYSSYTIQ